MLLYIIRHGHPRYEPQERLTEIGHAQARALAPRLQKSGITRIFSSPLRRVRETAEPTAALLGLPVSILPWASEDITWYAYSLIKDDGRYVWVWEDEPAAFVEGDRHAALDNWHELPQFADMPTARETYDTMGKNCDELIAELGYTRDGNVYKVTRHNEERVALFCHQGVGLVLLSHILNIPPNMFLPQFDFNHTGVTVLRFDEHPSGKTLPKLLTHSDMSHIAVSDECEDYFGY